MIVVCIGGSSYAREVAMRHYTVSDGLPSNTIYQVFRDSKGFLWVGTDKGVARFNGIRFEKFSTFDGLADNEVFFFTEDKYGRIWMGTFSGDLCYYKDDSFHTAANTPFLKLPVKAAYIYNITPEIDSSVTFNFQDKGVVVNISDQRTSIIKMPYSDNEGRRRGFARKLKEGDYIGYYSFGIANPGNSKFLIVDTNGVIKKTIAAGYKPGIVCAVNQGHTYFFGANNIYSDDSTLIRRSRNWFSEVDRPYAYYEDGRNYMVGYNNRLEINDSVQLLGGKWVVSVTQDSYGNYWIGTHDDGMYCMSKDFAQTSVFNNVYHGRIASVRRGGENIYLTSDKSSLYRVKDTGAGLVYKGVLNNNSTDDEVAALVDNNDVYYSFANANVTRIEHVGGSAPIVAKAQYDTYYFANVKEIYTANGYLYWHVRDRIFRKESVKMLDRISLWDTVLFFHDIDRIYASAQDRDSCIWYATLSKVYKVTGGKVKEQSQFQGRSFKNFDFLGDKLIGLTHDNRLVVCSDVGRNIHFDTVRQQECIWERITKLDDSHVLISTDGLYRVVTLSPGDAKHPYQVSVIENPLVPLRVEAVCADDKKCYFFAHGNVTIVDKQQLLSGIAAPRVQFTTLKTSVHKYVIPGVVDIPFKEARHITISFNTLAEWGEGVTWQYSVSRDDEVQWIDLSGSAIDLIDPGYGNYTVRIRAKSIGSEYGSVAQFILNIAPPFWATWWFISLCILAGVAITVLVVRMRLRYVVARNKKAHEGEIKFMRSEYKALNALMNPHFIFNTLNNVQGLFNENDKVAANTYLRIFADLIRQNMHNVSKEVISLQKEMELVANYLLLEKLRFEDKLSYSIDISEEIDLADIMIPPLLIQPIVENSLKHGILPMHGVQGKIWISIAEEGVNLVVEVRDNGVGISNVQKDEQQLHESFGLSNIRKRVEQLSILQGKKMIFELEDIKDAMGNVTGSRARLTIEG